MLGPKEFKEAKSKRIKDKKCKECLIIFTPQRPLQSVCSPKCAIAHNKKLEAKKEKKEWSEQKAVLKEKLKTLSDWKDDLQVEINKIVRLIDKYVPCISSGATSGKVNSGHYVSRGSNDTIRFNLHNIFLQSEHSNTHLSGDTLRYQDGLKQMYGLEYFERVDSLRSTPLIKLSIDEIRVKISICRQIVKELQKADLTYPPKIRIELRESLNKRIGIYL